MFLNDGAVFVGHNPSEIQRAANIGLTTITFNYEDGVKADIYVEYFDIHNSIRSIGDSAVYKYTLNGDKWTISSDWLREEWTRIE